MKAIFTSALVIAFALVSIQSAHAKQSHYVLEVMGANSPSVRIRLKNKTSGRTIWTRTVGDYRGAHWSGDHRAFAVETSNIMLVWRAGHRLLTVAYPGGHALDTGPGYDYSMGYRWSPDKKHLLARFGSSGDIDVNSGYFYCLKLGEHYYNWIKPPANQVWKMRWRDNHTVLSWYFDVLNQEAVKTPRVWHVP